MATLADFDAAIAAGDWRRVLALGETLCGSGGLSARIWRGCHDAAVKLGEDGTAWHWLERALAELPDDWLCCRLLGDRERAAGNVGQALAHYTVGLERKPENPELAALCGVMLVDLQRHREAREHLERATAAKPEVAGWHVHLAKTRARLLDFDGALASYRTARALAGSTAHDAIIEELQRKLAAGTHSLAADAGYYDAVYATSDGYAAPWRQSPYVAVWEAALAEIGSLGVSAILDLGCGPGQFAAAVAEQLPGVAYTGVDFSAEAVAQGRRRCPQFRFEQANLPLPSYRDWQPYDALVAFEALEHVDDDLALLAAAAPGTRCWLTVPNFDAHGHVRFFASADDALERYAPLLDEASADIFPLRGRSEIYLLRGRRCR